MMSRAITNSCKHTDLELFERYLPKGAVDHVIEMFEAYPCQIKIVPKRSSKHGDFRRYQDGKVQITVNAESNPYRFLITLIHEYSHFLVYQKSKKVKPHGREWKAIFQRCMLPLLHPGVFPDQLLSTLAHHMKNPKASSDRDLKLSLALREFDEAEHKTLIFELPEESKFSYRNRIFVKGEKRRTRFECIEVRTHKKYIFHPHAEVEPVK